MTNCLGLRFLLIKWVMSVKDLAHQTSNLIDLEHYQDNLLGIKD
jgi:hypothetical protein